MPFARLIAPPYERLKTSQFLSVKIELRLIVEHKLMVFQTGHNFFLDLNIRKEFLVHLQFEKCIASFLVIFHMVHGKVCVFDQAASLHIMHWIQRYSHGNTDAISTEFRENGVGNFQNVRDGNSIRFDKCKFITFKSECMDRATFKIQKYHRTLLYNGIS